jgi:hypothetical protein
MYSSTFGTPRRAGVVLVDELGVGELPVDELLAALAGAAFLAPGRVRRAITIEPH